MHIPILDQVCVYIINIFYLWLYCLRSDFYHVTLYYDMKLSCCCVTKSHSSVNVTGLQICDTKDECECDSDGGCPPLHPLRHHHLRGWGWPRPGPAGSAAAGQPGGEAEVRPGLCLLPASLSSPDILRVSPPSPGDRGPEVVAWRRKYRVEDLPGLGVLLQLGLLPRSPGWRPVSVGESDAGQDNEASVSFCVCWMTIAIVIVKKNKIRRSFNSCFLKETKETSRLASRIHRYVASTESPVFRYIFVYFIQIQNAFR